MTNFLKRVLYDPEDRPPLTFNDYGMSQAYLGVDAKVFSKESDKNLSQAAVGFASSVFAKVSEKYLTQASIGANAGALAKESNKAMSQAKVGVPGLQRGLPVWWTGEWPTGNDWPNSIEETGRFYHEVTP